MKRFISAITLLISLVLVSSNAQAQGKAGKFGFGITDVAGTGQRSFILTGRYWMVDEVAIDAGFGFRSNGLDILVLEGGLLKTIGGGEKVYPYFGGKLTFDIIEDPIEDAIVLSGTFGAEYFVVNRFSVIGESRFAIQFDGGTSVTTEALLSVLFYLK